VGADRSIHPEDALLHLLELGARERGRQDGDDTQDKSHSLHGLLLF
jgi:hypothetical protein